MKLNWVRIILGTFALLLAPQINFAQNNPVMPANNQTLPGMVADTTIMADTTVVDTAVVDTPIYKKVYSVLQAQVPEVYTTEGKLKLRIPIAWREDIIVPLPKAFQTPPPRPPYDPVFAWQRSLILPGWGQIYNGAYWKLPIFYAGYAAGVGWVVYNHNWYRRLQRAYLASLTPQLTDDDPDFTRFDSEGIRSFRQDFRNRRDQGILILAAWHIIQVAEAYVDANLRDFDVSEDLSFSPFPTIEPAPLTGSLSYGLGINFKF